MVSRRSLAVVGPLAWLTTLAFPAHSAIVQAKAMDSDTSLAWLNDMPAHACDCHHHIIGDYATYPMLASRVYTPPTASVAEIQKVHKQLRITRSVVIQPSFYGEDNRCLLSALSALGPASRGIAVIPTKISPQEIDRLTAAGVRGVRINQTGGANDPAALASLIDKQSRQAAEYGWHVQLFLPLAAIGLLAPTLKRSPATFVFDHFAGANSSGVRQPGFASVVDILASGKAYVKLTAPYHEAPAPLYPGMGEAAQAFVKANVERVLWGTDWPHTNSSRKPGISAHDISPFYPVDNLNLLRQFYAWVPDRSAREQILAKNPTALFGFGDED